MTPVPRTIAGTVDRPPLKERRKEAQVLKRNYAKLLPEVNLQYLSVLDLLFVPISPFSLQGFISFAFARTPVPGTPLLEILFQPLEHQFSQLTIAAFSQTTEIEALHTAPLLHFSHMHMHQMRWPVCQIVQNVCRVHDCAGPDLRLPFQEGQEVTPAQQVQIDRDLIQQQYPPRSQKAHRQLHASSFPVTHSMHAPSQVNVQNVHQLVPPLRVVVPAYRGE